MLIHFDESHFTSDFSPHFHRPLSLTFDSLCSLDQEDVPAVLTTVQPPQSPLLHYVFCVSFRVSFLNLGITENWAHFF